MTPILAEGHRLPSKACYWAIQYRDAVTKKLVATRASHDKHIDPQAACRECFGMNATVNFTFFNLGTTMTEMRKNLRKLPD